MSIRSILWPTDFSDDSRHALEHAVAIARWYSARIVAVHAFSPVYAEVPVLAGAAADDGCGFSPDLRAELVALGAGIETSVDVVESAAAPGILQYAVQHPIDLIVIGTHGNSGFRHLILGSVTEKVLRTAPCPVLTVPPRAQKTSSLPFKRIICPTDFSASSCAAMNAAATFARDGNAKLTLVHVLDDADENELFVPRPYDVHHHRELLEKHAREQLDALSPPVDRESVALTVTVASGKPYQEILRIADEERADLIVMGVEGRTPLDVMMFGSTTNQVVRRATCPVLTLRRS
ncbi:MAG TPA: universal stress protein [Vicinamibacterales bacterium]|nr:universal stress protein [Vicinamibacterales bacterium]